MTGPHHPHPHPHPGPHPHSPQQPPLPGRPPAAGPTPATHARLGGQILPVPQLQIPRFASKTAIFTYGFLALAAASLVYAIGMIGEEKEIYGAVFVVAAGAFGIAAMLAKLIGEVSEIRFATHIQALIDQQRHLADHEQGQPQGKQ